MDLFDIICYKDKINMRPTVSVCMISFNHAKYISQAIESVINQKTSFEFELVIRDDMSSDDTYNICKKYADSDNRINLLYSNKNIGIMENLKACMDSCRGEFIAICEGDDYWTDGCKLEKQVKFLKCNDRYSAYAHQSKIIKENAIVSDFSGVKKYEINTVDLLGQRLFHTASFLFRRQVLAAFCESPLVLSCDRLLFICSSMFGPIYYNDDAMCVYRLHSGGISSNVTVEQLKLDLDSVDYLAQISPWFNRYQYYSYIYATIGMCRRALWWQKIWYLSLSFLYSFSFFPKNIIRVLLRGLRLFKICTKNIIPR